MNVRSNSEPSGRSEMESSDRRDVGLADRAMPQIDAAAEWRRPMTGIVLGLLIFETITGLLIYLAPFSIFNQFGVLWHSAIGLLMLPPMVWYLGQHWWRRYRTKFNHYQLLGYVALAVLTVLCVSGVVLTWQGLFGIRMDYGWDLVHLITGLASFTTALSSRLACFSGLEGIVAVAVPRQTSCFSLAS